MSKELDEKIRTRIGSAIHDLASAPYNLTNKEAATLVKEGVQLLDRAYTILVTPQ